MNIKKSTTNDGTIDADYIWGRPVTTYVSILQHLHLLLLKARLATTGSSSISKTWPIHRPDLPLRLQ